MTGPSSERLHACYQRIYTLVRAIPPGKVMTYGQIALLVWELCAGPVPAIQVGRALAASVRYAPDIPWWRVIGRLGNYGVLRKRELDIPQRDLLAREGVVADTEGRYALAKYLFEPE